MSLLNYVECTFSEWNARKCVATMLRSNVLSVCALFMMGVTTVLMARSDMLDDPVGKPFMHTRSDETCISWFGIS